MVLISAHRCGAGANVAMENTRAALLRAISLGVDFVEFDVQRCADGELVLFHDSSILVSGTAHEISDLGFDEFKNAAEHYLRYEDVLTELRQAGVKAHIDLKFTSPKNLYGCPEECHEVMATKVAVRILGAENVIITTLEDKTVRAVRSWSRYAEPKLLVGLSLGRDVSQLSPLAALRVRLSELIPGRRYAACDANLVVVNLRLAKISVASFASRRNLPMLVWTVDEKDDLIRWLADQRAWLVTTNYPEIAIEVRAEAG